jgi:hypothetical protein
VAAFLLLPMASWAFDLKPDATRIISDPAYLPLGGQLYGSTEYSNGQTHSNTQDSLGNPKYSTSTPSNTVIQLLEYGVTDDFTVRVADSYEWNTNTNTYPSGAVTTTDSNGFTDPTFALIWRVLDEKDQPVNFDLFGTYNPNLISAQAASVSQTGTIARGGDSAACGIALSHETRDFTVYLQGEATYLDNRSILNQTNNVTTNYDSSWEYLLDLTTQTRFSRHWSLNVGLSQTFEDNENASYTNTTGTLVSYVYTPGGAMDLTAALNYQPVSGIFCVSFIYTHDFEGDSADAYPDLTNYSTTTTGRGDDVFSGELRYVFN